MTMSLQAEAVFNEKLAAQDPSGRLYNEDLAPTHASDRRWNSYQLFSLWMNDAHNAGNYTWAAGLFVGLGMLGFVLLILGVLGLAYGGFSYTKDTTLVKLGPIEISSKEKQAVNVPMWAGIGAIAVGGLLLVLGGKR